MKAFLIYISLFLASFASASPFSFNKEGRATYNLFMQFKENGITGICIIKAGEDLWKGSVINEFGVKAFDFTYQTGKQKVKLLNVTGFMNKWYIKKTIRSDWKYLLSYPNHKKKDKNHRLTVKEDGTIILENRKHSIQYVFTPIETTCSILDLKGDEITG